MSPKGSPLSLFEFYIFPLKTFLDFNLQAIFFLPISHKMGGGEFMTEVCKKNDTHYFIIAGAMALPGPGAGANKTCRGRGQKNMPGPGPKSFAGALAPPGPGRKKNAGAGPGPRQTLKITEKY